MRYETKGIVISATVQWANNIAAYELLFRLGIVGDLLTGTMAIPGSVPAAQGSGPGPRSTDGHLMLADTPWPHDFGATLANVGPLSEGFERSVASPLQPRRLRAMGRTV
jgi:hypothetical protein